MKTKKELEKKLDELDRMLLGLLKYLEKFSEAQLNQAPSKDKWTALQISHHLILAEGASQVYLEKKLSYNPELKRANLSTYIRAASLKAYLRSPLKWKAPAVIGTNALPKESNLRDTKEKWLSQRLALRQFLMSLDESLYDKELYKHPFVGRITIGNMMGFFKNHFIRHEKQIIKGLQQNN